ncbi:helix-turn-helix domain-containing protein [Mycolicibacterium pulveris]|nr:helix-turn-helix domain-containing protein [Mycolicibacterium pulveris]
MSIRAARQPLTTRQRFVLRYLRRHAAAHGYCPSHTEVSEACGLGGSSGAHRILSVLEARGYVRRLGGKSRGLELTYPEIGPLAQGSAESFVLTAVTSFQRAVRHRLLRTSLEADLDDNTMTTMLADATARNRFLARYAVEADELQAHLAAESFKDLLDQVGGTSTWPEFVVDHAVFNEGSVAGASQLLATLPQLEPALLDIIDISDTSLRSCRRWLADVLAMPGVDARRLQRRALLMEHVSRLAANIVAGQLQQDRALGVAWGNDPLHRLLSPPSDPADA